MYLNMTIKTPREAGKLTVKKIKGTPYVYYEIGRTYDAKKKYNSPKRVCIQKGVRRNQKSIKSINCRKGIDFESFPRR